MIKILHVISDTNVGGAGVHLCNLLSQIDRERYEASVCLPEGSLLTPRIRALDIPVEETRRGGDRSADLLAIPELMEILGRLKPQILHTHSALYARLAGRFCHVPALVNTRHCATENASVSPFRRLMAGGLERMLGGHTIATADYVKEALVREGASASRISVVYNGSPPLPQFSESEKAKIRQSLGISHDAFTVGMVARLEKGKGHDTFLGAAALCLQKDPNIQFVIAGDGSLADSLRHLADRLGLGDRVIFLGFCQDVSLVMNVLHLNVNCSERSETSSLSLSEGMSVGAVPVVSRCGGNPFMVGFGQCGMLFLAGDEAALADCILALQKDRASLRELSLCARRRYEEQFTAVAMTRRVEALYQSLLRYSAGELPTRFENSREK